MFIFISCNPQNSYDIRFLNELNPNCLMYLGFTATLAQYVQAQIRRPIFGLTTVSCKFEKWGGNVHALTLTWQPLTGQNLVD